ncbi:MULTISPECIES: serine/threonine protein kinase [unclassified Nostoc]|uniref:serine/threonine protein kinase n=1 Tax=unclassified Nostoc TaxID=2593658 RepID=UPI00262507F0|nr:serine/threonine-protein kinase [Nostoc sp. S13]MDF5734745.1 protein kinase [Nostoc sp. S13]
MNSLPSNNFWIGRLIGDSQRYRLEKRLGRGGMGEVFLATDMRVGKDVALKLLNEKLVASGEMRKRFEREIAICAALGSDHIIEISDCGVTTEGYPFYVMEYLRGQTLRQLLMRERQLPPERVVKIMTQVCKGLQLAHRGVVMQLDGKNTERIKVIHRDLKPDNIFLVPTDFGEWVKILDFGIAKIYNESSEQTNLTKTFIGTLRYSSPEQIQNNKNIDVSADIYSLGIIIYEMLSAADPFGLSIQGNNISEPSWLLAHSYEPPRPLREQPGCEQLSPELEIVVIKCLQKNPSNRFASVEQLSKALQAAITTTKATSFKPSQTIVQARPLQRQTQNTPQPNSNDETVVRPLQPSPQNPLQPDSNDVTINKPLRPLSQTPQPGSNDETIIKPLQPPSPQPASNLPRQQPSEGTIMQKRPSNTPQQTPEDIIFQPGAGSGDRQPPDKTLFQPRPTSNPGGQQVVDNTIMQQQPRAANSQHPVNSPLNRPENTIFQQRPASNQRQQQIPEQTIFQPRKDIPTPQKKSFNTLRMGGIILAIALVLGIIFYFIFSRVSNNNDRKVPTSYYYIEGKSVKV